LVGNKIDMSRIVSTAEAEKFAKSKKLDYLEASAKENEGVHEIFYHLGRGHSFTGFLRDFNEFEIKEEIILLKLFFFVILT
jgi:hypothetical protein